MMTDKYVLVEGEIYGGVKVLGHDDGWPLVERVYEVEHQCCGKRQEMKHSTIRSRRRHGAKMCLACACAGRRVQRVKRAEERRADYGFIVPGWPVPLSVQKEIADEV